jgi:hypothetical protein
MREYRKRKRVGNADAPAAVPFVPSLAHTQESSRVSGQTNREVSSATLGSEEQAGAKRYTWPL